MSVAKEPDLVQTHELCEELSRENERLAARLRTFELPPALEDSDGRLPEPIAGPVRQVPRAAVANALEALAHNEAKPKASRVSVAAPKHPLAQRIDPLPLLPIAQLHLHDRVSDDSGSPEDERALGSAPKTLGYRHPLWLVWFCAVVWFCALFAVGVCLGARLR